MSCANGPMTECVGETITGHSMVVISLRYMDESVINASANFVAVDI
jgi:hypothetical protein